MVVAPLDAMVVSFSPGGRSSHRSQSFSAPKKPFVSVAAPKLRSQKSKHSARPITLMPTSVAEAGSGPPPANPNLERGRAWSRSQRRWESKSSVVLIRPKFRAARDRRHIGPESLKPARNCSARRPCARPSKSCSGTGRAHLRTQPRDELQPLLSNYDPHRSKHTQRAKARHRQQRMGRVDPGTATCDCRCLK